jgi:hypothetical protein
VRQKRSGPARGGSGGRFSIAVGCARVAGDTVRAATRGIYAMRGGGRGEDFDVRKRLSRAFFPRMGKRRFAPRAR